MRMRFIIFASACWIVPGKITAFPPLIPVIFQKRLISKWEMQITYQTVTCQHFVKSNLRCLIGCLLDHAFHLQADHPASWIFGKLQNLVLHVIVFTSGARPPAGPGLWAVRRMLPLRHQFPPGASIGPTELLKVTFCLHWQPAVFVTFEERQGKC